MKFEFKWEKLDNFTARAKVIGGWVVSTTSCFKENISEAMVFVPDPKHEWVIDKE